MVKHLGFIEAGTGLARSDHVVQLAPKGHLIFITDYLFFVQGGLPVVRRAYFSSQV